MRVVNLTWFLCSPEAVGECDGDPTLSLEDAQMLTKDSTEPDGFGQWQQDVYIVTADLTHAEMQQCTNVVSTSHSAALRCYSKPHYIQPTVGLWVICEH